ncbi:MAG: hypothetical protein E7376_03925 [Clostridiales bacterium]|nr:hypothetical protein [Clostridiales bacterium]
MQKEDLEFFNQLVKSYFGKCEPDILPTHDKDMYHNKNVKYHLNDRAWLCAYVFNKVYSEFNNQNPVIFQVHDYVASEHFDKIIDEYKKEVINTYTKKFLLGLSKSTLSKIEPERRENLVKMAIATYLQNNLNISKGLVLNQLAQNNDKIKQIIQNIVDEQKTESLIEKY